MVTGLSEEVSSPAKPTGMMLWHTDARCSPISTSYIQSWFRSHPRPDKKGMPRKLKRKKIVMHRDESCSHPRLSGKSASIDSAKSSLRNSSKCPKQLSLALRQPGKAPQRREGEKLKHSKSFFVNCALISGNYVTLIIFKLKILSSCFEPATPFACRTSHLAAI